jgi:ABC-type transport system involved in cytochrome c biogenesis permease subunit
MMRLLFCLLFAVSVGLGACAEKKSAPPGAVDTTHRQRARAWDADVLDTLARLPVQDHGRVKPLATVAQFALLSINGNRDLRVVWSDQTVEKLPAIAWLLDCFFYPEQAKHYRCLRVDNNEAIVALGLHIDQRKRLDRYSFAELAPAFDKLMSLAGQFGRIEPKQRTPVQGQVVDLYEAVTLMDRMLAFLEFGRRSIELHRTEGLTRAFPGASKRPASFVLGNLAMLGTMAQVVHGEEVSMAEETKTREREALGQIFDDFERVANAGSALAVFAPTDPAQKTWLRLHDLVTETLAGRRPAPQHVALLDGFERMVVSRDSPAEFAAAASAALAAASEVASQRGEFGKIGTELSFYRGDYFYRALLVFGLAFVLAAFSWLRPASRWLMRGVAASTIIAWVLLVAGITYRCIIRSRPPVSTLYETILFIAAIAVAVGLVMEWINRQRIGITLAAFFGMLGMFLARKFEELEGVDTMPQLVAVLDTNFWLSTHVTTVTMGYSAGLLAALLAHVYIVAKLIGRARPTFLRSVARMTYGTICFGLLFSVVGTILGGVWANYSWGRFWGWDPKENGALLICLAQIAILHGRMSGWLRDHGIALASIGLGVVVAFSWWHVNQLGVGLHSYGFTQGILTALTWFYASQLVVFVLGLIAGTRTQHAQEPAPAPAPEPYAAGEPVPAK